ncbi:membrane protease subunit [Streptomyces sp. CB02488]|uniref:SPFH domain-containing protein n=1 Tax=Streptomyces sp. CB02488 TaxID=1703920 RepID=UPI00093D750D|nr:SPFH domain-containing protein [Streptomyces sp. CB02488]OKK12080.1 membrane protease subunit [Streptomyces sp. CB02488]
MRSTVPDSSGNQEHGENGSPENPGYGEERYGALPVREWAAPDRPERAGPGGPYDWSAPEPGVERGTGPGVRSGPDSVVDLVLDLTPGAGERGGSAFGATSASVSVPGTAPAPDAATGPDGGADAEVREGARDPGQPALAVGPFLPGPGLAPARRDLGPSLSLSFGDDDPGETRTEMRTDTRTEMRTQVRVDTGRRHSVIANERTASIPVHLLFRDDPEVASDAVALPATVVRRASGIEQPAGVRRPPPPRSGQVRPSTRPAPVADPRLNERPGPALPGWAALLAALGSLAAAGGVLWWTGALPGGVLSRLGLGPRPYDGIGLGAWAALALLLTGVLFALGGLTRGRVGYAWVLTLFGQYRGSVRRTGLMWVSPLLLRRRVDVRLRHWRSEPLPAVDANGTALRVVVLVVWRVEDTVRATLGIADHEEYLREQVEAAMARVLSQLPADAFHEDAHTLRNAEAVGDALTRMLKADCEPVGIEVYSAQPTGIEYAPEVAAAMQRRRIAAIDAKHRDSVLTSVVDAVDDTVSRLTARGLVELDDYERKSLVKDLTVAFYTGRGGGDSA